MVGAVIVTCLGVVLITVVAHDVFDALFHHRGADRLRLRRGRERFSLPVAMPYLLDLAARGGDPDLASGVWLRAAMLSEAIDDFAATTAARPGSVDGGDTVAILRGYARDHLVDAAEPDHGPGDVPTTFRTSA